MGNFLNEGLCAPVLTYTNVTEIELPTYFFEFLTRLSKLKPDWSIQRHCKHVTKLY